VNHWPNRQTLRANARGTALSVSVTVTAVAVIACSGGPPPYRSAVVQAGSAVATVSKKKEKSPKITGSVTRLSREKLQEFLYKPNGHGNGRPNWEEDDDAFDDGAANTVNVDAVGGGTVDVAIMPEQGNFKIDADYRDWEDGRGARAIAKLRNLDATDTTERLRLGPGEVAYWFVERDGKTLRSYFVRESDAHHLISSDPFVVCHPLGEGQPRPNTAAANIISGKCGGMNRVSDAALFAPWIPCVQGCCIAGNSVFGKGMRVRKDR
jgi:hypothetical protein